MIKKIFTNQSHSITGAAIILGAASFLSRFMGVVRDRIFAHAFGAGDVLDAYYAAFRIPDLIFNLLIVGALSAGFIPIFLEVLHKDEHEAGRLVDALITILTIALIIISGIGILAAPWITKFIVPGFTGTKLHLTIVFSQIMFLSPIILGISSVVSGVLQSFKNFLIYSLAPVMYNIGIIVGALVFVPIMGMKGLAWGVILGAVLHLVIQLPTLWSHGFRYRPLLAWNQSLKKIVQLMIPRTMGLAAYQINMVVVTTLASTLAAGSITIFNLANNLQYFPIGIIGYSFSIAAFPTFAQFVAENRKREMIDSLSLTIRQIIFLMLPITIVFLLLRAQIVRVVLGSGKFDWDATILTANTLAFFTLSLFAQALIPLLARAFYALNDTWIPFVISLTSAFLSVILSIYLKEFMGVIGLALAFSISMIVQLMMLWMGLRKKLGSLKELTLLHSLYKLSISALIMAVSIQLLKYPLAHIVNMTRFWGILTQGILAGVAGLLIYTGMCYLLKVEELIIFQASLKRRWIKLWHVQEEIGKTNEL